MALILKAGIWQWCKMIDGVMLNKSTKTADKKIAKELAKKWERESVQQIKVEGLRPVMLYDAIDGFLDERLHMAGYRSCMGHMKHWKTALPNVEMKSLVKYKVQHVVTKYPARNNDQVLVGANISPDMVCQIS